jgi:hypothetical protein
VISLSEVLDDLDWLVRHDALDGIAQLVAERRRQIETKGFDARHDAGHEPCQLAYMAGSKLRRTWEVPADSVFADQEVLLREGGALCAAALDRVRRGPQP